MTPRTSKSKIINRTTYAEFIRQLLTKLGGVASKKYVLERIERQFSSQWGRADRKRKRVGKHGWQPTWQNEVDWAIVQARRNQTFFHRGGVLILNTKRLRKAAAWAFAGGGNTKFQKLCHHCDSWNELIADACEFCQQPFPAPKGRREAFTIPTIA